MTEEWGMDEAKDLSDFLNGWPPTGGRINARIIDGDDGKPKLQVRVDLGVLQMELTGRPDGRKPEGFDSLFEHHQDRLQRYVETGGGSTGFVLSSDDCRGLREEAVQFYHRYVALFAVGEYTRVVDDTMRNLAVFDFCRDHGETEADRGLLDQFRPHLIAMRTRAQAELSIEAEKTHDAAAALDAGLAEIRTFYLESGTPEAIVHSPEIALLTGMREQLIPRLPASQRVELQERLQAALDSENYELAAILRDELRMMP